MARHNPARESRLNAILKDEFFQEVLEASKRKIIREWKDAETLDEREMLHARYFSVENIASELQAAIRSEKVSAAQDR